MYRDDRAVTPSFFLPEKLPTATLSTKETQGNLQIFFAAGRIRGATWPCKGSPADAHLPRGKGVTQTCEAAPPSTLCSQSWLLQERRCIYIGTQSLGQRKVL